MYHNKELLATRLYEVLDDLILTDDKGTVSIDKLLNPQQKYDMIMHIMNGLPITDFERVLEFNTKFKVKKETTHVVPNFTQRELRYQLILEEVLELGNAFGFTHYQLYATYIKVANKVNSKNIEPNLVNVLDAFIDILFVTYGGLDVCNLTDVSHEAMEEVYNSNMSKLIPDLHLSKDTIKASVKKLKEEGKDVVSLDLKNGYVAICDVVTGKILKPIIFSEPDLQKIINKHFKN